MLRNTDTSWGLVARSLHWLMAFMVIGLWAVGKFMVDIPDTDLQRKFEIYQLHKSTGLTLFALLLMRLLWRFGNPTPSLPETMSPLERNAAHVTHIGLYLAMIGLPVTGYLMSAASPLGLPTMWFGLVSVPHIIGPSEATANFFKGVHEILSGLIGVLFGLHVAGALKHHFVNKDDVLRRMTSGRTTA